jgi:hypothetical protein
MKKIQRFNQKQLHSSSSISLSTKQKLYLSLNTKKLFHYFTKFTYKDEIFKLKYEKKYFENSKI